MNIDFAKATFKNFENIPNHDMMERSKIFNDFLEFMKKNGHLNYRLKNNSGCSSVMNVNIDNENKDYISFVSNDYLGFTQHPKVKKAIIDSVEKYGCGAGASPLIGGHFSYHEELEIKIAKFFGRPKSNAVIFTTGYTANSATLQILLQKEDIAIIDSSVHTSVYEGCILTNKKTFPHNNMEALENALKMSKDAYRTKIVIVDGIYSQDGDVAPLDKIIELVKTYGAYLMVDDAHGIGVLGETGRGVLESFKLLDKVDIITGTFSKTFGNIGGYVIANDLLINFLKFQSRQLIFSATSPPTSMGIIKAIELIDEEPEWRKKLWENITFFKEGLQDLGFNIGSTCSAIIPVKIGNPHLTGDVGKMLIERGIYTNPILYPAVAKNDARIRMAVMATHTKEHLEKTLNAFEDINKKLYFASKSKHEEKSN